MSEEHEGFVLHSNGLRMWNVQQQPSAYFGSVWQNVSPLADISDIELVTVEFTTQKKTDHSKMMPNFTVVYYTVLSATIDL